MSEVTVPLRPRLAHALRRAADTIDPPSPAYPARYVQDRYSQLGGYSPGGWVQPHHSRPEPVLTPEQTAALHRALRRTDGQG